VSDESTQTNIRPLDEEEDDAARDDDGDEPPRARQHPLPWILFGFATIVLALVGGLLAKRLSSEKERANQAIESAAGLKAQLEQLAKSQAEVDKRVADADAKVKAAEESAAAAVTKLAQVEGARDKLQKELEALAKKGETTAPEPTKKEKAAAKKKKKKGKRR
jgi:hypothetical protein